MIHPALQSQGNAEGRTPVVLLTGADRLSLDSVAFSLVDSFPSVCSIAYVCFDAPIHCQAFGCVVLGR